MLSCLLRVKGQTLLTSRLRLHSAKLLRAPFRLSDNRSFMDSPLCNWSFPVAVCRQPCGRPGAAAVTSSAYGTLSTTPSRPREASEGRVGRKASRPRRWRRRPRVPRGARSARAGHGVIGPQGTHLDGPPHTRASWLFAREAEALTRLPL